MSARTATLAALVTALALSAPTAQAATSASTPLTLESGKIGAGVLSPANGQKVVCDGLHYIYCGSVTITAKLSGFSDRNQPAPGEFPFPPLYTSGTADITRVYGCETAQGRRLHNYDTKVVENGTVLTYRRNLPRLVPTTDAEEFPVFAHLMDAQPGNCPKGTSPRLYRITAKHATFTMESQWDGIPASTTYRIPGQARWDGSAPTPAL